MAQMNVSMTEALAGYVRGRVRSGRFSNASEVVREALRRMQEQEARSLRLESARTEDVLADLDADAWDDIRRRVSEGLADAEAGRIVAYEGEAGMERLRGEIRARRGRRSR
jgi:antitoxin ParD1/3/4